MSSELVSQNNNGKHITPQNKEYKIPSQVHSRVVVMKKDKSILLQPRIQKSPIAHA